jgi:hypothetical protein
MDGRVSRQRREGEGGALASGDAKVKVTSAGGDAKGSVGRRRREGKRRQEATRRGGHVGRRRRGGEVTSSQLC